MKEYSNTDVTDKVHCPPLGAGGILDICTYNQQLPIKVKKERLQLQVLIEKKAGRHSFQNNTPVPV